MIESSFSPFEKHREGELTKNEGEAIDSIENQRLFDFEKGRAQGKMTRIYLVRHGTTDWNKEEIFRGRAECKLNETGKAEAQAWRRTSRMSRSRGFTAALCPGPWKPPARPRNPKAGRWFPIRLSRILISGLGRGFP